MHQHMFDMSLEDTFCSKLKKPGLYVFDLYMIEMHISYVLTMKNIVKEKEKKI